MQSRRTIFGGAVAGLLLGAAAAEPAAAFQRRRRPAGKPAPAPAKPAAGAKPAANPLEGAMAQVEKAGGRVMQIAQNDDRLDVSFHLGGPAVNDTTVRLLPPLAKKLIHLDLGQTGIGDAGVARLKPFTALVKLHLEGTKVTDAGLANLKGLTSLEYLNLYGTGIGDAGLTHLTGLKNLKKLFLWQTKVTDAGVEQLKKALPGVEINRGFDLPAPAAAPAAPEKK